MISIMYICMYVCNLRKIEFGAQLSFLGWTWSGARYNMRLTYKQSCMYVC